MSLKTSRVSEHTEEHMHSNADEPEYEYEAIKSEITERKTVVS